jgi:hypothetical protein
MPNQTGPRTPEGKARSSLNAIKHGLRSSLIVIPGLEDEQDWCNFYEGMVACYAPVGALECALVDRAAGLIWRLRRVPRAERHAALNAGVAEAEADPYKRLEEATREFREAFRRPDLDEGDEQLETGVTQPSPPADSTDARPKPRVPPRILPEPAPLLTYSRYESRLDNQLRHTLRELQAIQAARKPKEIAFSAL